MRVRLLIVSIFYLLFFLIKPVRAQSQIDLSREYSFGGISSLAEGISYLITPALSIAGLAVLLYFIYGAFKLVFSGGDKNAVAEARGMITHAIIGFILLFLMFVIFQYLPEFLGFNFRIINFSGQR